MIRLFREPDLTAVQKNRGWFMGLGTVLMVLGLVALLLPFVASLLTTIAIGWVILLAGLAEGYHAVRNRGWSGAVLEILSAVVQVAVGLFLVAFPLAGKLVLTLVLAMYFVAEGVIKIVRAVQHSTMYAWGLLLFDGLVSIALGVLVLLRWPGSAVWMLGLLVGVHLFLGGTSMLLIGLSPKQDVRVRA